MTEFYKENIEISQTLYAIWSGKISNLQIFYRLYRLNRLYSVSVHVIDIVIYKEDIEILLTFLKPINGSSFPVD